MGKLVLDAQIDLQLAVLEGDTVVACSAQPAVFADVATYKLADQAISGASYTKANGDVDGRKNTCAPTAGAGIDSTGVCTHIAITKDGTTLKEVFTCASQALTAGGTVDFGNLVHEIGDVT
jgi:hypothetical protein